MAQLMPFGQNRTRTPVETQLTPTQAVTQAVEQGPLQPDAQPPNWDFSHPGAAEDYFANTQGAYTRPGVSEDYWNKNQGALSAPGQAENFFSQALGAYGNRPAPTNNAQGAYNDFQSSAPQSTQPYFDNARRAYSDSMNSELASRGAYGSSAGLGILSRGLGDLSAQEARENAQYGLQRAGLGGQLASGADASERANSADSLGWLTGVGGLGTMAQQAGNQRFTAGFNAAQGLDQGQLTRLISGQNAATTAQDARRTRGRDMMDDLTKNYAGLAGMTQDEMDKLLQDDQALLDAQLAMFTGAGSEYYSGAVAKENKQRADLNSGLETFASIYGAKKK